MDPSELEAFAWESERRFDLLPTLGGGEWPGGTPWNVRAGVFEDKLYIQLTTGEGRERRGSGQIIDVDELSADRVEPVLNIGDAALQMQVVAARCRRDAQRVAIALSDGSTVRAERFPHPILPFDIVIGSAPRPLRVRGFATTDASGAERVDRLFSLLDIWGDN